MRDDFLMRSIKSRREAAQSATTRASIAFWYQNAACREDPDPNMPPAGGERSAVRKNQYNLHIRLDEDERAALEKGCLLYTSCVCIRKAPILQVQSMGIR